MPFTLVLCYQSGDQYPVSAQETVSSTYIPQIKSMINGGDIRSTLYQVVAVSQSVGSDGSMNELIYVYLAEISFDEVI